MKNKVLILLSLSFALLAKALEDPADIVQILKDAQNFKVLKTKGNKVGIAPNQICVSFEVIIDNVKQTWVACFMENVFSRVSHGTPGLLYEGYIGSSDFTNPNPGMPGAAGRTDYFLEPNPKYGK